MTWHYCCGAGKSAGRSGRGGRRERREARASRPLKGTPRFPDLELLRRRRSWCGQEDVLRFGPMGALVAELTNAAPAPTDDLTGLSDGAAVTTSSAHRYGIAQPGHSHRRVATRRIPVVIPGPPSTGPTELVFRGASRLFQVFPGRARRPGLACRRRGCRRDPMSRRCKREPRHLRRRKRCLARMEHSLLALRQDCTLALLRCSPLPLANLHRPPRPAKQPAADQCDTTTSNEKCVLLLCLSPKPDNQEGVGMNRCLGGRNGRNRLLPGGARGERAERPCKLGSRRRWLPLKMTGVCEHIEQGSLLWKSSGHRPSLPASSGRH